MALLSTCASAPHPLHTHPSIPLEHRISASSPWSLALRLSQQPPLCPQTGTSGCRAGSYGEEVQGKLWGPQHSSLSHFGPSCICPWEEAFHTSQLRPALLCRSKGSSPNSQAALDTTPIFPPVPPHIPDPGSCSSISPLTRT